jgi:type II secretory pathway component GspD/PulD (secretin)
MELALTSAGLTYQKEGHCYLITAVKKNLGICRKKIYPLNYFTAKEALELIKPFLKEGEIISADTQNHRLLIAATGAGHKEIAEILTKLDRPEKQVVLEAKIIELSSDAMKTAGIQWPPKIAVDFSQSGDAGGIWTTTIEGNKLSATLNLLEEKGYSRVLACPRLMVLSDKEAAILIGDRIPYQVSSVSASGNVTTKVEFIEAGIKLKIVPRINENQELTVLICPEVSYVYNWKGPASEIPWVKTRETKTTVRVKNGETIFIAGLLSEDEKEGLSGLPIFSQIPGVGNLFASKRKDQVKSEVVISITPKIVDY